MKIRLTIDNRETNLYGQIKERDLDIYKDEIEIIKEQLDIGDIHINFDYNNEKYLYIYERKTISDLISSIKDGRYKEQKSRLLAFKEQEERVNIGYIIEGDNIISSNYSNHQKQLTSVYYHSLYRDDIKVIFTRNVNETTSFILMIATKIYDNPNGFIRMSKTNEEYIDVCKIKTEKCKNINKDTCYLLQLSQIPGISKEIAKLIKNKYESLNILIKKINEMETEEEKIKMMMEIKGIGEMKAKRIIEYLS